MTLVAPARTAVSSRTEQDEELAALVLRCADRDQAALSRLYELTSPWVYTLLRRRTSSASDADDATVAVYSLVWGRATSYPRQRTSVRGWMTSIAFEAIADV